MKTNNAQAKHEIFLLYDECVNMLCLPPDEPIQHEVLTHWLVGGLRIANKYYITPPAMAILTKQAIQEWHEIETI